MSLPLDWEEGKYSPSIKKCDHGVFLTSEDQPPRSSVCSICQSTNGISLRKPKAVSKTRIRKIERQLPQIAESIIEDVIPEREEAASGDDPRELGEESESTDIEVETYSEAEGIAASN
jgi:hypothetical protein